MHSFCSCCCCGLPHALCVTRRPDWIRQKEILTEQREHKFTCTRTEDRHGPETHVAYISITARHHTPYRKHHSAGALSDCLRSVSPVPPNASTICLIRVLQPSAWQAFDRWGHLHLVAGSGHFPSESFPRFFRWLSLLKLLKSINQSKYFRVT